MKALIVLNLEDCTYEDIEEFGIDEISLDKKGGGCILWTEGFKIMPMPKELEPAISEKYVDYCQGFNDCISEILGEK